MNEHFKHIDDLSRKQRRRLAEWPILSVEIVGDPWLDDHEFCCDLRVTTAVGTVKCSIWWIAWEFLAAVQYANELPSALDVVKKEIKSRLSEENQP
jgi:hypothetical protein